ncbi:reverse transcriptase domain-containing protein [Tanacetum coccineum]
MVDPQPEREGVQGAEEEGTETGSREGPSAPTQLAQTTPSSAFIKENIDMLRTMIKEHDQQTKTKVTPKKLTYDNFEEEGSRSKSKSKEGRTKSMTRRFGHKETSLDSDYEEDSEDTCEDLSTPYKRPKPTPFTTRITCFKYHRRAKLPRNIKVYGGSKDPEDHLGIFSATAKQEEWPMLIWCKMFHQTLSGAARIWFDDLDPKSVDSFEELSQKFLEEFSQQKRYAKDPTAIHGI